MTTNTVTSTMIAHIGRMNLLAISGGRVTPITETVVQLPVAAGYRVEVTYDRGRDLYDVRRLHYRAGRYTIRGEMLGLYADQLADAAYRASCYLDDF